MGILLDTGFLFSLKIKQDKFHGETKKLFKNTNWKSYGLIATSNLIVNELYTLVNIRTKANLDALTKLENLFWGKEKFFNIIFLQPQEYKEIAKIMIKYSSPERILSFVDASLIYLSKKLNYTTIVSYDSHFDGILTRISL